MALLRKQGTPRSAATSSQDSCEPRGSPRLRGRQEAGLEQAAQQRAPHDAGADDTELTIGSERAAHRPKPTGTVDLKVDGYVQQR